MTMQEELSFDRLPEKIQELHIKIDNLTRLVSTLSTAPLNQVDEILTVKEAAEFLGLKESTIYAKSSRLELPLMKHGKRIYFSKNDLKSFLKLHRVHPDEIAQKAKSHLKKSSL